MKSFATNAALLAALIAVTGCNTVKGLGRDIESVGRTGEEVISHAPTNHAPTNPEQDAQAVHSAR